jgi:hypothetical protein
VTSSRLSTWPSTQIPPSPHEQAGPSTIVSVVSTISAFQPAFIDVDVPSEVVGAQFEVKGALGRFQISSRK